MKKREPGLEWVRGRKLLKKMEAALSSRVGTRPGGILIWRLLLLLLLLLLLVLLVLALAWVDEMGLRWS
jgi:hypothetical protein